MPVSGSCSEPGTGFPSPFGTLRLYGFPEQFGGVAGSSNPEPLSPFLKIGRAVRAAGTD
jgi:hypothetical protein